MIGVKKAKIIVEIKKENKILENNILDLIRSQTPKKATVKKEEAKASSSTDDGIPLTDVEELN